MAKREGQRAEAFEAGQRNVIPGQAWIAALARGLQRELAGADMGTPAGRALREELGSLGYEQALREGYPEDYAMGRAVGSDWADPLSLLAMRGTPLRGGAPRLAGPSARPRLAGPGMVEGEVMPSRLAIEQGPHLGGRPPRAFAGPVNEFERNAVSASQIGRRGYGMGYREPSYWEEGGQGFRPGIDDFVEHQVVRNPEGYFDPTAIEQASSLIRQGRAREAMHPIYGANADRPPYGVVPPGAKGWADRPNPGMAPRYRGIPGREPFAGEIGEGPGYFAELPRPGVRSDVRNEIGQGAGAPRLRYEPVQGGGRALVPQGEAQRASLPTLAQGRGLVPTMIEGEFSEVPGLGYAGGRGAPWSGTLGGADMRMPVGRNNVPFGNLAAVPGALMAGYGLGTIAGEQPEGGPLPPWNPLVRSPVGAQDFADTYPLNPLAAGQEPPQAERPAPRVAQPSGGRPVRQPSARPASSRPASSQPAAQPSAQQPATKPAPQQGWEPNINYIVTQALDALFGQGEAERGRRHQQYFENHPGQGY